MKTYQHHRPASQPAYFLGRPASVWIQAISPERAEGRRRQSLQPAARQALRRDVEVP